MTRWVALVALAAAGAVGALLMSASNGPSNEAPRKRSFASPLIGANFTHFSARGCETGQDGIFQTGIIANWQRDGVPALVRRQLVAMHANGLRSLRLILWHQTDASGAMWGVISSRSGRPSPLDEEALIGYFEAVREAGFARLTLTLAPMLTNDPSSPRYHPPKLDENWAFLRRVRSLVKRYGPASTHIDLVNEGTPNPYDPAQVARVHSYLAELYRRYVTAYGNGDVTVSAIVSQDPPDIRARLQNLIDALRASRRPLPRWFDVHVGNNGRNSFENLKVVEAVLKRNGLRVPLTLGEVPYEDAATAEAIARYGRSFSRRVLDVMEWPLTPARTCGGISVSPPYSADAYLNALAP